jgi:hypothetical protein
LQTRELRLRKGSSLHYAAGLAKLKFHTHAPSDGSRLVTAENE